MAAHSTLGGLARDLESIAKRAPGDLDKVTRLNADRGINQFHISAKRNSGSHGKHYPNSATKERLALHVWEYGPDSSNLQGGMSPGFEHGSRNSPPHADLAHSADLVAAFWPRDVVRAVDRWFW